MAERHRSRRAGRPLPEVYARLAHQAEVDEARRTPSRVARWAGWAICLALVAGVVVAAVRVSL